MPCCFVNVELFADAGRNDLAHIPNASGLFGSDNALFFVGEGELGGVGAAIQASDVHAPAALFLQHTGTAAVGAIGQIKTLEQSIVQQLILQIHDDPPIQKYYLYNYIRFCQKINGEMRDFAKSSVYIQKQIADFEVFDGFGGNEENPLFHRIFHTANGDGLEGDEGVLRFSADVKLQQIIVSVLALDGVDAPDHIQIVQNDIGLVILFPDGTTPNMLFHRTKGTEQVLTISKSITPLQVVDNDRVTYTFVIQNSGNQAVVATDNAAITDTFDPVLTALAVTFEGAAWTQNVQYNYNETTGLFTTVPGQLLVPAASYTQDPVTGEYFVAPGIATLVVTGTI